MRFINGIVHNIGELVKNAETQIIEQMERHEIQNETTTTDRFLGTIVNEVNQHGLGHSFPEGFTIRATTLTDRGPNSQESRFGADSFHSMKNSHTNCYKIDKLDLPMTDI